MLTRRPGALEGFSLIELMIVVAVLGIVLMVGLPNVSAWIQNTQLKTAAEAMVSGLQLARAEALRRNTNVRFQLVSSLTSGCVLTNAGPDWVVSLADPSGKCDVAPSDIDPQTVQKRAGSEGSLNATLNANAASAVFNGLGRLAGVGNITQINISNPSGGACKTPAGSEPMRCLRIVVSTGGQVRMCDPAVDSPTDSRYCEP